MLVNLSPLVAHIRCANGQAEMLYFREAHRLGTVAQLTHNHWNGGSTHSQSGDRGWWVDFSSVTTTGTYYLYDTGNDVRSYEFEIRDDVYNDALKAATRMFYYNRSGIAKVAPYAESNWQYNGAAFQQQDSNCRYYQSPDDASTAKIVRYMICCGRTAKIRLYLVIIGTFPNPATACLMYLMN